MAVEEFQFKIARAKDLPLSWFELVLCPEKFQDHLKTLERNPSAEPTAVQLIITFLEKANCIEGQAQPPEIFTAAKEKRKLLVECALFLAAFLHWDTAALERSLPPAVQFTLASLLSEAFPLSSSEAASLSSENPPALTAHVILNQWLVRFAAQYDLPTPPQRGSTWEVSCATPEQISTLVTPRVPQAVAFLTKVCKNPPQRFVLPRVSLELPLNSKGGGEVFRLQLPGKREESWLPADQALCQLWYDVGVLHFKQEEFVRAHSAFSEADHLLSNLSSKPHPPLHKPHPLPLVNSANLRGYLSACECVLGSSDKGEGVRDGGVQHKGRTLIERIEEMRINNFEDVTELLAEDVAKRELSSAFRTALEMEASDWSESVVTMETEPAAKRPKLEQDFSRLPLQHRLCICNAVRSVLEGESARPQVWQLLAEGSKQHFDFLFHVCGKLLQQKESALRKHELQCLQTFVRSVCSSTPNGPEVWKQLLTSGAKSLALPEDMQGYAELLGEPPKVDHPPLSSNYPQAASHLEREIQLSLSSQELLTAVEQLFKALPATEHKTTAAKWVGAEEVFAAVSAVADPVLLTKYNALVHRTLQLKQAKSYPISLKFLQAAVQLLSAPPTKVSPLVRQRLAPRLQEQILSLELMAAREHFRTEKSQRTMMESKMSGLVGKAEASLKQSGRASLDPVTTQVATAFLFNAQQLSFLAAQAQPLSGKTFAPKLAAAVLCVKEGGDMRKPSRELFEAVLGVFSPPLNSTDSKSEQNERQSKLRSYLDVFVENLVEPTSLSLLLAALARMWNLLEKPDDEILSEFNNNWPTAIGNPGSIDSNHVLRSLTTSLRHGLSVHPRKTSWIIMQADMYNAMKQYGPALEGYMEAGALSSKYFEQEVAAGVWTQQVYQRMIGCCSKLDYHTHAVVFCQFLDPVDYELAFSILRNHSNTTMESLFNYFWDMTIIEYLIYIHSKKGDTHKQMIAIQVAGQPELNFNNSSEVLGRAVEVRRRRFLRTFFKQIIS